jgi:hypothetical protein
MIRFLLVLLAFVSALLAFIFQETVLFVASGGLLMVSVVLLLLQVREQSKRKNRLKLPNDLTPEDELRARGVLEIRPKSRVAGETPSFAPPESTGQSASETELQQLGILEIREKTPETEASAVPDEMDAADEFIDETSSPAPDVDQEPSVELAEDEPEIPWSALASDPVDETSDHTPDLFATPVEEPPEETFAYSSEADDDDTLEPVLEDDAAPLQSTHEASDQDEDSRSPVSELPEVPEPLAEAEFPGDDAIDDARETETLVDPAESDMRFAPEKTISAEEEQEPLSEAAADDVLEPIEEELVAESEDKTEAAREPDGAYAPSRRHVEVDAHLPALQTSLGAHTICLIDVDTKSSVYRLRSIVSSGLVDHAGTEYPFAGFFLSDLLAETSVLDIGPSGLSLPDLRYHRDTVNLEQVIATPVMSGGLPAAFLVAGFEETVDESRQQAVTGAAQFFSSLYALQGQHPTQGESPLVRAKRKPPSLRLVKSNPQSSQSRIIAEEMTKARGNSNPLALALVCLDKGDEISRSDEITVIQVEEWMRRCLEEITPDGRIEYLGELGYGIIQLRDVSDVEGWVRRAQYIFKRQHGPVDAQPIVGVAMLSDGHRNPEDLQADAVRALRAAYETGDSTILVG